MTAKNISAMPSWLRYARENWRDRHKAIGAKVIGESISIAAGFLSSTVVSSTLLRHPYGKLEDWVSEQWVEPNLDAWKRWLKELPSIDTPADQAERENMEPKEQAMQITSKLLDVFGLSVVVGFAGQLIGNRVGFRVFNMIKGGEKGRGIDKREELLIPVIDSSAMFGGMFLLNQYASKPAVEMQKSLQSVLEKLGWDEETAEYRASWAVNKQAPNLLAFALSTYMTYRFMKD